MHARTLVTTLAVAATLSYSGAAQSPSGPVVPPHTIMESKVDSSYLDNRANRPRVVFQHRFKFADTSWLQLRFGEATNLPDGSFLRMTAKKDGGVQRHDGVTIGDWGMYSALFNGGEVLLELVAGPNTQASHVTVAVVIRGLLRPSASRETICGSVDDRKQSFDKRQGRLWRGCSGWLIGPNANKTLDLMITAGHCRTSGTKILELNVPNSRSTGALVRAAPNDQYPYTEPAGLSAGIGADWAVCLVGKNSNTGKLPTGANGGVFYQLGTVPSSPSGQNITITGYGTSAIRTLTQVQKIHTGPLSIVRSTSLCYSTDTTGGNSGSPVIHANTSKVIGIHTHGGCTRSGGCNSGTRIDRADLQAAILANSGKKPGLFTTFGTGCNSSPLGCNRCDQRNWTRTLASKTTTSTKIGILGYGYPQMNVCGIDLYASARGSAVDVTVSIQEFNSSTTRPGRVLASGKVRIGTTTGVYTAKMGSTVPVANGSVFYVTFDNADKLNLPVSNIGTMIPHAEFGTSWGALQVNTRWQYRIHCDRGMRPPILSGVGKPVLGRSFNVNLSDAPSSVSAIFLLGLSNTTWGSVKLPLTYAAPCQLLVSPDVVTMMTTSALGTASVTLTVPNRSNLVGVLFYNQYLVTNAANPIGVIASNGGQGRIGEF